MLKNLTFVAVSLLGMAATSAATLPALVLFVRLYFIY
jgi:hypothetical protein